MSSAVPRVRVSIVRGVALVVAIGASAGGGLALAACVSVPPQGSMVTMPPPPPPPGGGGDAYGGAGGGFGFGDGGNSAYGGGQGFGPIGYGGDGYGYGGGGYGSSYGGSGYGGSSYGGASADFYGCAAAGDCTVIFVGTGCLPGDPRAVATARRDDALRALRTGRPQACGIGGRDYEERRRAILGRYGATCTAGRCTVVDRGPQARPGF